MDSSALVIADPAGVICFWSPGAERAFGYRADQAVGQTLDLIVPAEYREAHWRGFRRAIETGVAEAEGVPGPFPVRHAGGDIAPIEGRLTLVRQPQGRVVAAIVAFG